MTEDRLIRLITRQMSDELDSDEFQELEAWAKETNLNRQFLSQFAKQVLLEHEISLWTSFDPVVGYKKWIAYREGRRKSRVFRIVAWSAVAALLIAVVIGGLVLKNPSAVSSAVSKAEMGHLVIAGGRNTATLTLSNGHQILLDTISKGALLKQGNARLVKVDSSNLSYVAEGREVVPLTYNTLTTPRSGQYRLTLPDGTRVWLNNVSSIRYPTSFPGKDRIVELVGEAYFEIAKDVNRPFLIKVKDATVEVLGTCFNVMAYPEEGGTQTTLLTGAVRVNTVRDAVQLKPDEQAQIETGGRLKIIKDVPSEDVVSWKTGFFYFGRASFSSVMRQLARWYDVDVIYQGKIPNMEFGGKIDRGLPLDELLKYLDRNQVHFRLEGRKLIVLPN